MSSIHLSSSLQTRKQVARAATVALVGVAYFTLVIAALHFLRPDQSPIRLTTSMYAVGPHGWLMSTAFFGMSVASFALLMGLAQGLSQPARSRIGFGFLGLWAVGLLVAMIFPIDLDGAPQTLAGTIHRIAGPLAFLSLIAGTILVSRRFRHDARWRSLHGFAMLLSWLMLAGFVAMFLSIAIGSGYAGLSQRLLLAVFVTWFLLAATRLRSTATGTGAVPA